MKILEIIKQIMASCSCMIIYMIVFLSEGVKRVGGREREEKA